MSATAYAEPESDRIYGVLSSVRKAGSLSRLILFRDRSLLRALAEFVTHYHSQRHYLGKGNALLSPPNTKLGSTRGFIVSSIWVACCATTAAPSDSLTLRANSCLWLIAIQSTISHWPHTGYTNAGLIHLATLLRKSLSGC